MPNTPIQSGSPATAERRQHSRVQPSGLVYLDIGAENGGIMLDLNEVGAGVQAVAPLMVLSKISIRFQLPDSQKRLQAEAQIAWVSESRRRVGLRFTDVSDEVRAQIRDWLRSQTRALTGLSTETATFEPMRFGPVSPDAAQEEWASLPSEGTPREEHETFAASKTALDAADDTSLALKTGASSVPPHWVLREIALEKLSDESGTDAPRQDEDSKQPAGRGELDADVNVFSTNTYDVERAAVIDWPAVIPTTVSTAEPAALKSAAIPVPKTSIATSAVEKLPISSPLTSPTAGHNNDSWKIAITAIAVVILLAASFESGRWLASSREPAAAVSHAPTTTQPVEPKGESSPNQIIARGPRGASFRERRIEHPVADLGSQQVDTPVPNVVPPPSAIQPSTPPSPPALPNAAALSIDATHTETQAGPPVPDSSTPAQAPARTLIDGRVLTATDRFNPAHLLYHFDPDYPPEAKQQHLEGTVTLRLSVGATGSVDSIRLLSGPSLLVPAAISAVKNWRYLPALLNGEPVKSEQDVSVEFRLPADQ